MRIDILTATPKKFKNRHTKTLSTKIKFTTRQRNIYNEEKNQPVKTNPELIKLADKIIKQLL